MAKKTVLATISADPCRTGESEPTVRSGVGQPSGKSGVLKVQCADAEPREGIADPGSDHGLQRHAAFTFILKTPPASVLIRKAIGIEKAEAQTHTASRTDHKQQSTSRQGQKADLTAAEREAAMAQCSSARSMGVDVEGGGGGLVAVAKRSRACEHKLPAGQAVSDRPGDSPRPGTPRRSSASS